MHLNPAQLASKCLMLAEPLPKGHDIFECRNLCSQCGSHRRQWDNFKSDEFSLLPDGTCEHDKRGPLICDVRDTVTWPFSEPEYSI
jgi:hypothetical protein